MSKIPRILLVDDDLTILELYGQYLQGQGYEVALASTGREGLALARQLRPALVLLDLRLPDLDGRDVCRRIKADPAFQDVFVALISGEARSSADKVNGLEVGADEYLTKPIELSELRARVRTLLRLREATAALRSSEATLRMLLDNIPDPAWMKDGEGRFLACNQSLARFHQRAQGWIIGRTVFDLLPREAERLTREDKLVMLSRRPVLFEAYRLDAHDRSWWLETIKSPILDAEQQVVGTVGIARDITDRKWMERQTQLQRDLGVSLSSTSDVKEAARRLSASVRQCEGVDCVALFLVDKETGGLELVFQEGMPVGFGQRAERKPRRASKRAQTPSSPVPLPVEDLRRLLRRRGVRSVESIPIRDGQTPVALLLMGSRESTELPARSRATAEVIAAQAGGALARIRTEQALRANRQLLEQVLQSLRVAVFVLDAGASTIMESNPAAARMFGVSCEALRGQSLASLHASPKGHRDFKAYVRSAGKKRGRHPEFELPMARADGSVFPSEHRLTPLRNDAGTLVNWVSIVRDITSVKQNEEELKLLSRRIVEAQEAERLRVARELHDGINQVIASAKLRVQKVEASLSPSHAAAGKMLARSAELLGLALEENRRIAHNLRPSDLDALGFAGACRYLGRQLQERANITVRCRIPESGFHLSATAELNLFRVVQEALTNVERHAAASNVSLRLASGKNGVVLQIRDDGRGFNPQSLQTRERGRSGVGLESIRDRARLLGGECELRSSPRRGTTVTIRIPAGAASLMQSPVSS